MFLSRDPQLPIGNPDYTSISQKSNALRATEDFCTFQLPENSCILVSNRVEEMSGRATVRLLFLIACTLPTFTDSARPLEEDEFSTVILRLLETSQQISHLPPPRLSPAHQAETMFNMHRKSPSPTEEYKIMSESPAEFSVQSLKARSRADFDRISEQQHRTYTYSSVLHKNPAGPNPIGNEYRPGNTIHNVKKLRYPPPQG